MESSSLSVGTQGPDAGMRGVTLESRPSLRALAWLAFLGPFFFITYGFANWWTSRLAHVDVVVFEWEKKILFLDWTILPYMSIDLFYALSLFLCTTRSELDTHAKRLLCATLISVTGFLLFPLQFSFDRPPTSGFNGALFNLLTGFDKPFNQAPSLHISLLMLLWAVYARHLRGVLLWSLHIWFFLIGVSVFTTYQHHVIDGITGCVVGVVCFYLFPDHAVCRQEMPDATVPRHQKVQGMYLFGSTVFAIAAYWIRSWGWMLLWPASALLLVSLAYAGYGTDVFRKCRGKLDWPARLLLAPYRLGAWWSSRWYTRQGKPSMEVIPGLWIGRAPGRRDWLHLDPRSVLDLTAEFNSPRQRPGSEVRCVPMLDLATPSLAQLKAAVMAIDAMYAKPPLLVHCALGYSRSALAVAAWLLHRGLVHTAEEAVERIRAARPQIVMPPAYIALLETYVRTRSS